MSIQAYINNICSAIIYRLNHLDRFTDYIFIPVNSILSPTGSEEVIYYEKKEDTYELCDIIHNITKNHSHYNWIVMLLLLCPEHEPHRELEIIDFISKNM